MRTKSDDFLYYCFNVKIKGLEGERSDAPPPANGFINTSRAKTESLTG